MAKRVAVLMKLKDGVSRAEVRELCALLHRIGELTWMNDRNQQRKEDEYIVQKYNDEHGDPCFYIP